LGREGGELLGRLREPELWVSLLAGLLLWSLAYQVTPGYAIAIGGDRATHKRGYDAPLLADGGFNDSEPGKITRDGKDLEWWEQDVPPYRWATDDAAVLLPGVGGERWALRVLARSGRPVGAPVESHWQVGDDAPITLLIDGHPRVYTIVGGAPGGDLRLTMRTQPFDAPGDSRTLGLVVHRIAASPIDDTGPYRPAPRQLALLATIQVACYSLTRRLALARRWSLALALSVAAISASMLAVQRLELTIWMPALAALSLICYLLAVLLAPLLAAAVGRSLDPAGLYVTQGERDAALAATIGAFALRMAGLLHPYAIFSDLGFNVNNLDEVIRGDLFLYAGLPCEAGSGKAPYPPAQYLALAPMRLLFGAERLSLGLLIQAGNALLESSAAALLWLLLRRAGLGRRAALMGAALYVVAPPLLRSFSVGEFANIFGQSLLAPLLLFLALGAPLARRWPAALVGGALLLAILLSHTGTTISVAALLLAWLPLWWLGRPSSATVWPLLAGGGAAVLAALALFYSFSGYITLFEQRLALEAQEAAAATAASPQPSGTRCPPGYPIGEKLKANLAAGFGPGGTLAPLLGVAGGLGVFTLWKRQHVRLDLVLLACWLGMLLSLATLLWTDQAVRWQHALFPALCLGTAPLLAGWMRRGRAGWALALVALGYLVWFGVALWVEQIVNYLH
jgi:hypothetical protein